MTDEIKRLIARRDSLLCDIHEAEALGRPNEVRRRILGEHDKVAKAVVAAWEAHSGSQAEIAWSGGSIPPETEIVAPEGL